MTAAEISRYLGFSALTPENWTNDDEKLRVYQIRATFEVALQLAKMNEEGILTIKG